MNARTADIIHAVLYVLPGLVLLAMVAVLRAAGARVAAYAGAPRWARRYYRFATGLLLLLGAGQRGVGGAFAAAVLRH